MIFGDINPFICDQTIYDYIKTNYTSPDFIPNHKTIVFANLKFTNLTEILRSIMTFCKKIYLMECEFENSQVLEECVSCWTNLSKLQIYKCAIPNEMVDEILRKVNLHKLMNASVGVLTLSQPQPNTWTQIKLFEALGIQVREFNLILNWYDAVMELVNYVKTTYGTKLKELKLSVVNFDINLANPLLEFLNDWQDLQLNNFAYLRNVDDCDFFGPPTKKVISAITNDSYAGLLMQTLHFEPDDDDYIYPKSLRTISLDIIGGTSINEARVYASDENLSNRVKILSLQTSNLQELALNLYVMENRVFDLSCLSNLRNLKRFYLSNQRNFLYPALDFRKIGKMEAMISFQIKCVAVLDESLQKIIASMPDLEYLDLEAANSVSMSIQFFKIKQVDFVVDLLLCSIRQQRCWMVKVLAHSRSCGR
jgi:hypothetical protein